MWRRSVAACGLGLLLAGPPEGSSGAVVEAVEPGFAAERAGLRPGDLILSWLRDANPPANPQDAGGAVGSELDLWWVELEQAPRGTVTLTGRRGDEARSWRLPAGSWEIEARPRLIGADLKAYEGAVTRLVADGEEAGGRALRRLSRSVRDDGTGELPAWLLFRGAARLGAAGRWDEAAPLFSEAAAAVEEPAARALLELRRGEALEEQKRIEEAAGAYGEASRLWETVAPKSLAYATSLSKLGNVAWHREDLAAAEGLYRRAMELREALAPGSLAVARGLNNLGLVELTRGELGLAEAAYRQALAFGEARAPRSRAVASSLTGLGRIATRQGNLADGEGYLQRALEILDRLDPESLAVVSTLNSLGVVARNRGDVAVAEAHYRRALDVLEPMADRRDLATTDNLAAIPNNLGVVLMVREDLAGAERYFRRALEVFERQAPASASVASALNNLGIVARRRGDLQLAEGRFRQALDIHRRDPAPVHALGAALSLHNLGNVAADRGDSEAARGYFREALSIQERLAPESLAVADTLDSLGNLALELGELASAERLHGQALAIRGQLAPGSTVEALSSHALGRVWRRRERPDRSLSFLRRAVEALEDQVERLGGSAEGGSAVRAEHMAIYQDLIEVLLDLRRPAEAFHVLERSRARGFLALLAERDLLIASEVPEALERDRRSAAADYDRTHWQLGRLSAQEGLEAAALREQLGRIRRRQGELRERIRTASPRLAALRYPEPLPLNPAREVLGDGTVLLAYSVGAERSHLFVVEPPPPEASPPGSGIVVLTIPMGEADLRDEVGAFRSLIRETRLLPTAPAELRARALRLYAWLVEPAEPYLRIADRILISPDGPLHALPFAALVRREAEGGEHGAYLAEWKPSHTTLSATLYGELRRARRAASATPLGPALVAFGDPAYPSAPRGAPLPAIDDPSFAALLKRGYALTPLPGTRREIERIVPHFATPRVTTYLGPEATEERAKAVGADVAYLHFACHVLPDERFPLEAALALSIPAAFEAGKDNGLLQAWEILEGVRLEAELVVLSACASGMGQELAGEGMIGLTRAFLHAGARSVLSSLWEVADTSTAELMAGFYAAVGRGTTRDLALREAQIRLIRGGEPEAGGGAGRRWAHPYHWAAFQLVGDPGGATGG